MKPISRSATFREMLLRRSWLTEIGWQLSLRHLTGRKARFLNTPDRGSAVSDERYYSNAVGGCRIQSGMSRLVIARNAAAVSAGFPA
jgi:hypothetical protein